MQFCGKTDYSRNNNDHVDSHYGHFRYIHANSRRNYVVLPRLALRRLRLLARFEL